MDNISENIDGDNGNINNINELIIPNNNNTKFIYDDDPIKIDTSCIDDIPDIISASNSTFSLSKLLNGENDSDILSINESANNEIKLIDVVTDNAIEISQIKVDIKKINRELLTINKKLDKILNIMNHH